uniref:Serine/threonine-protein kinase ATR n=2 Tax=Tetranychus urticae TaxID=32264 RepID=T1JZU2_TETUR
MDEVVPDDALRGWLCLREALMLFAASQDESALNPLFTNSLLYFFCAMVQKANDHAHALLENFFTHSDLTASFLTAEYGYGLPRQFVAQSSIEAVEKSLKFVKKINHYEALASIFRNDFHNSMLIEYHRNPRIAAYVVYKIYISESCSIEQENFQDTKFIIMLEAQMGPFIIALNRFLLKSGDVLEDKRLAVESLGDFLNLLGPRKVPAFKMNIMGILLTAFNQANGETAFLKTLLKIWNQFLNSCGPNDIGPHLSVICKDLSPYFDVDPQATAKIFKRIVVDNENNLNDRFKELHFLPKVSYMKEVHAVLSKYLITKSPKDPNEARDYLKENIRYFDQLFNINNPDVKALHVKKLTSILSEFKKALAYLCLPNKEASTDIIIAKIIRKLLISSQISDTNLLISIAECLGEIGAIDPGRLDLSLLSAHQISDGGFIEFSDLPVTLLSKLANTLDSIDQSRIRDCLCYSIQEILKSYSVRENDDIWSRLPTDVQRNIKRFFTTKYIFKEEGGIVNSPVFHAEITYDDWLYKWSMILIERIERVTHQRAFEACLAIIKYNSTIARFLLPTIFWMALLDSNEATIKTYIIGEINAIIEIQSMDEPFGEAALVPASSSSPRNDNSQNRSEFNKIRLKCARTIFAIIDGISQLKSKMFPSARKLSADDVETKSKIELLENNLKKTELAELAFECQAYARALLYMEDYIWKNRDALSDKLVYFQKYFLSLDEPDGVEGINAIRDGPASLMDTILYHEANSELNYSLSGCEIAIKKEPDNLMYPKTLLRCLMNLDQHATAFNYATGLIQRKKQWSDEIYPYMVEASWKLHNWDDLELMLRDNESLECDSLGVNIGHLIDCIHSKDETNFRKMLREIRKREMDPLSISSSEQGAYIRCYQHILRLHMLTDIEKFAQFVFKHNEKKADVQIQNDFFNLIHDWIRRNNLVQSSLRCQEQVFNLQRVLLSLHNVLPVQTDLERAQCSLSSAKLARKSLNLQRAYTHLVESQDLINSNNLPISLAMHLSIETAKFHWAKGDQESKEHCIKELKRELEKYEAMSDLQTADRIKLAKLKLLFTKFSEKLSNLNTDSLNSMYRQIIRHLNESRATGEVEEPYFCLARFSDRLMKEMEPRNPERPKLMVVVAKHYSQALKYGSKHVYESMPRLLSIWCDLGSSAAEFSKTKCAKILETNYTESCTELTTFLEKWKDSISLHLFFTAFSQLLSRICHGNSKISEILMNILAKLVKEYPNQSMWMLIGVLMNRKNKARADKCAEIIQKAVGPENKRLIKLVKDMKTFALLLIRLCNCETQGRQFHVKSAVPELNHALKSNLGPIMLPYQAFMNVRMKNKFESSATFRPFPTDPVYIQTFDDLGEVLSSQARPKKVVINCSDGKKYSVMCKPKDDLRKDARTMELNNLINRLLKRDPETRKRGLHIRTYTVVPLDNDCGLIEWVKNLQSLRESIQIAKAFRYPNQVYPDNKEILQIIPMDFTKKASADEIVKRFAIIVQKHSPTVLGEWFIQTFPDPTSWYMARLAFTRSAAVMSIVGYIIGLGDRHPENFLLDSSNGEAMHVDFNLIFNQGDLLEIPEKVPFRLTQNMIAAMGVTGYEGAFRKTCEVTLRLMREKKEALMSVLQPFVYDPLCEWKKANPRARTSTARSSSIDSELVEATNTKALEYVGKIEDRLDGVIKKNTMPISVSGQVRYLIEEATSMANLGRMFVGWSAYL